MHDKMFNSEIIEIIAEYFDLNSGICHLCATTEEEIEAAFYALKNEVNLDYNYTCDYHRPMSGKLSLLAARILEFGNLSFAQKTVNFMKDKKIKFSAIHYSAAIIKQPIEFLETLEVPKYSFGENVYKKIKMENLLYGMKKWKICLKYPFMFSEREDILDLSFELGTQFTPALFTRAVAHRYQIMTNWMMKKNIGVNLMAFKCAVRDRNYEVINYIWPQLEEKYMVEIALSYSRTQIYLQ